MYDGHWDRPHADKMHRANMYGVNTEPHVSPSQPSARHWGTEKSCDAKVEDTTRQLTSVTHAGSASGAPSLLRYSRFCMFAPSSGEWRPETAPAVVFAVSPRSVLTSRMRGVPCNFESAGTNGLWQDCGTSMSFWVGSMRFCRDESWSPV